MCDDVKGENCMWLFVCCVCTCECGRVKLGLLQQFEKKVMLGIVLASLYLAAIHFHVFVLDTFLQEVTQMFSTLCYQHKHVLHLAGSEGRT